MPKMIKKEDGDGTGSLLMWSQKDRGKKAAAKLERFIGMPAREAEDDPVLPAHAQDSPSSV